MKLTQDQKRSVTCPTCAAPPGKPCCTAPTFNRGGRQLADGGQPMDRVHGDRVAKAREVHSVAVADAARLDLRTAVCRADDAVGFTTLKVMSGPSVPPDAKRTRDGFYYVEHAAIPRPLWEAVRKALRETP